VRLRLREIRRAKDMTQDQLAEKSGVGRTTIVQLETGEREDTTISTLMKLAAALECEPSDLIFFSQDV